MLLGAFALAGCGSAGPQLIERDLQQIVRLLQNLRNDDLLQVEFEESNGREKIFLSLPPKSRDERARRLIELLKPDPSKHRFEIALRVSPRHQGEIAIWTRSFMQILSSIATSALEERAEDGEGDTLPSVFRWGGAVLTIPAN